MKIPFGLILIFSLFASCSTNKDTIAIKDDQRILTETLKSTLDSLISYPTDKKVALLWNPSIAKGFYRKNLLKTNLDSFQEINHLNKNTFQILKNRIYDSMRFEFKNHERIDGLTFLNELPEQDSIKSYFIVELSSSQAITHGKKGMIYIEVTDLWYHNGAGVISEIELINGKWTVQRVVNTWVSRMDTIHMWSSNH